MKTVRGITGFSYHVCINHTKLKNTIKVPLYFTGILQMQGNLNLCPILLQSGF